MKKMNVWGLLCLAFCLTHYSNAQLTELDCNEKITIAKSYMLHLDFLSPELKNDILNDIMPCVTSGNIEAAYISGQISLSGNPTSAEMQNAFSNIEMAAQNGSIEAQRTLGILYKKGIGTYVDLEKSLEWFKKSGDIGRDSFALYACGYFYMKGIGGATQNYPLAKEYFNTSSYPMAKHWLSIKKYFGFTAVPRPEEALTDLDANLISNSQKLASFLRSSEGTTLPTLPDEELIATGAFGIEQDNLTFQDINKTYNSKVIEFDWGETKATRIEGINFSFTPTNIGLSYDIEIGGKALSGIASFNNNTLTIEDESFQFKRLYKDSDAVNVTYNIKRIRLDLAEVLGINYLVGKLEGSITEFNEPIPPLYVLLKPVGETPTTPLEVVEEIRAYPNPTQGEAFIDYILTAPSIPQLEVYNSIGDLVLRTSSSTTIQPAGMRKFRVNLASFPSGSYVAHIIVNSQRFLTTIIKL